MVRQAERSFPWLPKIGWPEISECGAWFSTFDFKALVGGTHIVTHRVGDAKEEVSRGQWSM